MDRNIGAGMKLALIFGICSLVVLYLFGASTKLLLPLGIFVAIGARCNGLLTMLISFVILVIIHPVFSMSKYEESIIFPTLGMLAVLVSWRSLIRGNSPMHWGISTLIGAGMTVLFLNQSEITFQVQPQIVVLSWVVLGFCVLIDTIGNLKTGKAKNILDSALCYVSIISGAIFAKELLGVNVHPTLREVITYSHNWSFWRYQWNLAFQSLAPEKVGLQFVVSAGLIMLCAMLLLWQSTREWVKSGTSQGITWLCSLLYTMQLCNHSSQQPRWLSLLVVISLICTGLFTGLNQVLKQLQLQPPEELA